MFNSGKPLLASAILLSLSLAACGPKRLAVIGPLSDPGRSAEALEGRSRLTAPARIDFSWELNEGGSRASGVGVARVEPPYRARLDLFLENGETVVAAALVDDELRLPYGAPDDILPPVELMWGTLGVFRPVRGARLLGGDRLEGAAQRLRYRSNQGTEIHYEVASGQVDALEMLEGQTVVQWVRLANAEDGGYPESATYRNLVDFRELKITRERVTEAQPFDPSIWDPRQ
jgi:hypothetical protein